MADSSLDFVPMSERTEWADVVPLPPPATAQPVVEIARDEMVGDMMDYFWAVVGQQELSERVLALTAEIINDVNSSNYSVWEWRWRCVQALGGVAARAAEEKALMRSVATANPKNYQLWNHRRRVALALGPQQAEEELEFAAACLQHDAKNYHAWAHRQAVLAALGTSALWGAELAFTERLLRQDVRNNSAWNQRLCVLRSAPESVLGTPREAYDRELEFAAAKLQLAPHNACAWEMLRSLAAAPAAAVERLQKAGGGLEAPPHALAADPRYLDLCRETLGQFPACAPALALLADIFLEQARLLEEVSVSEAAAGGGDMAPAAVDAQAAAAGAAAARRLAREVLDRLLVADPIKRPFLRLELAALGAGGPVAC